MPSPKKKIGLIAENIRFTFHSVIYDVYFAEAILDSSYNLPIYCGSDIAKKELILKPTLLSENKMEVVYGLYNMTPQFYQQIINKKIRNYEELRVELKNIYVAGETVGYVIV